MTSNHLKPPLVAYSTKNKAHTPNYACQSFFSTPYEPLHLDHHDPMTPNRPTKESLGPLFLPSTSDTNACKRFTAEYSLTIGSNLSTNDSQDDNNGTFDNPGFNFAPKSSFMRKPGFKNKTQQPMMVPSTSLLKKSGTSKDLLGQFGSLIPDQSVSARLKPTARKLDYDSSDDENDNFKMEEQEALKSLIPIKSMSFPESKLFQIQAPECLYTEYKASYFSQNDNKSRFDRDYITREILDTHSPITIYKCKHAHDGQEYIVKCLNEVLTTQDRLNNTWHLLNQLQGQSKPENLIQSGENQVNHHLVRYYNAWREDGKLYIVLEFCTGGNLLDVMQRGQGQSEAEIIKILTDISTALQPLHQQNIVHGHIKPENILLSRSGKYKLGDLGLSNLAFTIKNHHNGSDYITMENAKYYFSPQHEDIYKGKISPSDKADVFSLGLVLSQLMLGTDLRNNIATWKELTSGNFDKLNKLESYSNSLKETIKRMLSHNVMERPSVKDLLDRYGLKSPRKVFAQEKEHNKGIKSDIAKLRAQLGLKRKKSS